MNRKHFDVHLETFFTKPAERIVPRKKKSNTATKHQTAQTQTGYVKILLRLTLQEMKDKYCDHFPSSAERKRD